MDNIYSLEYVSSEESNEADQIETQHIEKILRDDYNLYESREESIKRQEVLAKLNDLIKGFIYKVALRTMPEDIAKTTGGKIFTFGSYRLGVHGPGADIDVLCIAPRHVDRNEDFFGELVNILKANKEVSEICDVRDAYVPVIKMKYCGIYIDLLFARLSLKTIDENLSNLQDDSILKNCDKESILSLNGCRVTDQILSLVPNVESFRLTLRFLKLWARKRGLYSNVMGYLGGVSWAILVAKICQMFPKLLANKLIRKFFEVYSVWDWNNPVTLNEIKRDVGFNCPIPVWPYDSSKSYCSIITPAFPAMNSTYNVSETTRRILVREFEFSKKVTEIISPEQTLTTLTWRDSLRDIDFFSYYSDYLQIEILATNENDFKKWQGFVESKLRFLIKFLEDLIQVKVHPFPRDFTMTDNKFPYNSTYYFGIEYIDPNMIRNDTYRIKDNINIINFRDVVTKFCHKINEPTRNKLTMNVRIMLKNYTQLVTEITSKSKKKDINPLYEEIETSLYPKKRKY